jgi:bifunctional UDP-N-acetylglucosamine pyrophosphorylase/glucosamine-1-phosphate N-acetyltransferase
VLVLAAGEGTRMRSSLPKVLHPVLGRPMVGHVLHAVRQIDPQLTSVVTGAGREQVESWLHSHHSEVSTVEQAQRRGTGHAVRIALEALPQLDDNTSVVVLTGDTPLLTGDTLEQLVAHHAELNATATVLTAELEDPAGYGRIVRDADRNVLRIVEHKDATDEIRALREINSGMYVFEAKALRSALSHITTNNSQGEEYLTDVIEIIRESGQIVAAYVAGDAREISGVNDRSQLAYVSAVMRDRINDAWMREGVTIIDPATTWIESDVVISRDVTIEPSTYLRGQTAIAEGAVIGPDTTLIDCVVDEGAEVLRSHATQAHIGPRASVGPFSFLRPGTLLHEAAKVGAYVEIKKSIIGRGSKVPHLSYVGDATIGADTNIGAATVFVNYDGVTKHQTVVGDGVRIGSDSMLVAPLTIGDGAYTAAGSVITDDVPPGAMAVGRARQRNISGWVRLRRAGSVSDIAASKAQQSTETETE